LVFIAFFLFIFIKAKGSKTCDTLHRVLFGDESIESIVDDIDGAEKRLDNRVEKEMNEINEKMSILDEITTK
jgi:hypothetical protein